MRWTCCICPCCTRTAACASSPVALVALPPAPYAAAQTKRQPKRGTHYTAAPRGLSWLSRRLSRSHRPQREHFDRVEQDRMGGASFDAVARVLRDALSQRLGASRVLIAGDGRIPDADLTVEFLALDPQQGALRLDARWSFSCTARDRPSHGGRTFFQVPLEATDCVRRCSRHCRCFGTPGRRARDPGRMPG